MSIGVPSIVIDSAAPTHAQHLTTDINDAFGRLVTATNNANTALDTSISDVADDLATLTAIVPAAAAQSDQETATSTTTYVAPGRQQFHPSAAKVWAKMNMAAVASVSYNVTSITDGGTGIATVTIATDFSSADYCVVGSTYGGSGNARLLAVDSSSAAGSITLYSFLSSSGALSDPTGLMVAMFGDQ